MKYLLSPLLLLASLPAQGLDLEVSGGGLGQPLSIDLSGGKASQRFILVTSLRRDSISLQFLDGMETRRFGIGFDLPSLWIYPGLNAQGKFSNSFTLPTSPSLAGISMLHQAVTYPGTAGRALDGISGVVVVPLEAAGAFAEQPTKLSVPRQFASNIPLGDGRVLIVGGSDGVVLWQPAVASTEIFDPATRAFTPGPTMTSPRASHTQTRLKDGTYLLVGGVNQKHETQASCEIFDPQTGQFTAVGSLATERVYHQAVLMPDGRVVVIGGFQDLGAKLSTQQALESGIRQTEIYNPTTRAWSAGPLLRRGRGSPGAQDIGNDKILVIGGVVKGTFTPDLDLTCELYDMKNNTVAAAASLPTRTAFMTTFQLPGNRVLVAGGDAGPRGSIQNFTNKATTACFFYTAATNSWSAGPTLPVATSNGDALQLRDGSLVLAGGGDNTLYWPHGNKGIHKYDVTSNAWQTIGTLATGRNSGETVELQAGGLVVIGGGINNAAKATDTWELMVR